MKIVGPLFIVLLLGACAGPVDLIGFNVVDLIVTHNGTTHYEGGWEAPHPTNPDGPPAQP